MTLDRTARTNRQQLTDALIRTGYPPALRLLEEPHRRAAIPPLRCVLCARIAKRLMATGKWFEARAARRPA